MNKTTIEAHVEFNGNREKTKSIILTSEPIFNSEFIFSLGEKSEEINRLLKGTNYHLKLHFKNSLVPLTSLEKLLANQNKIKIILTKTNLKEGVSVLSQTTIEWRQVLTGKKQVYMTHRYI